MNPDNVGIDEKASSVENPDIEGWWEVVTGNKNVSQLKICRL